MFRRWSPIPAAFSATTVSLLYLAAGISGYRVERRVRFFTDDATAWSGTVIWWEVGVGAALIPVAVYFWRKASREVDKQARHRPPIKTATD